MTKGIVNLPSVHCTHICRQERLEQERRDRELALRLAEEDANQVEDIQPASRLVRCEVLLE